MKKPLCISGMAIGGLLALGPLWGLALSALAMWSTFGTLGAVGVSDPRELATQVGHSLTASLAGFVACPIGLLLLTGSIIAFKRKPTAEPATSRN